MTDSGFDGRFQTLVVEVLGREDGPHPVWADAPVASKVDDPRRRRTTARWPIRALAVAAVLLVGGTAVAGALFHEWADQTTRPPINGWVAFSGWTALGPDGSNPSTGKGMYLVREGQPARRIIGSDADTVDHSCPAFSPDGTRLAYGQGPVSGPRAVRDVTLVIADLGSDGTVQRTVETPVGRSLEVPCPTWSPDGRSIAFSVPMAPVWDPSRTAEGSGVWILSVPDGRITVLPDLLPTDLKWSPDGADLAIASGFDTVAHRTQPRDTTLWLYSVATGELRSVGLSSVDRLTWAPDGTRIAYERGTDGGLVAAVGLWVADRDGGGARLLRQGFDVNHGTGPAWSPDGEHIAYQRVCDNCREGHDVVLVDPDTAAEVVIPITLDREGSDGTSLTPYRLTWSPDGASLLAVGWGGGVPGVDHGGRPHRSERTAKAAGPGLRDRLLA